jgi:hypothetical protein
MLMAYAIAANNSPTTRVAKVVESLFRIVCIVLPHFSERRSLPRIYVPLQKART